MSPLNPDKLHITRSSSAPPDQWQIPRRYTLTHSDRTGDLFLTIGQSYNEPQISGWYARLMRDEVLAEWQKDSDGRPALHIYCHVSGGLIIGSASWRYNIFRKHLRQVIEAFRYGDRHLFSIAPELDQAQILVHFRAKEKEYRRLENWGAMGQYAPNPKPLQTKSAPNSDV
jgi:hypothetical protein